MPASLQVARAAGDLTVVGPHFIGVGMQKSGTRWLYEQLRDHPDFWMPPLKEFNFFARSFPTEKAMRSFKRVDQHSSNDDQEFVRKVRALTPGRHSLDTYVSLFEPAQGKLTGEITPDYAALSEEYISEIASNLSHLRILLMVRDPVSRAWSALNDAVNTGKLPEQVVTNPSQMVEVLKTKDFARVSFPSKTYLRWSQHLPVKVILLQEVAQNAEAARAEVLTFLGASQASGKLPASYNSKAGRPRAAMANNIREALVAHFADEVQRCASIFGGSATNWPKDHGL